MEVVTKPLHSKPSRAERLAKKAIPPLGLLLGVSIFVIAFVVANTDDTLPPEIANPAIDSLTPLPGAEVLRQSQVGVDLISGYAAELVINGVPIPPDQVNILRDPNSSDNTGTNPQPGRFDQTINRFLYQPLEGRVVPALKGDENCVIAAFWPISDPTAIESVEWCFTVA
jgi:hypothetical protein